MIRHAALGDMETLARLHGECFAEKWNAQEFARLLAIPNSFALLAPSDCGFVLARIAADEAEILSIAVRPDCRRRRFARALMQAAAEEAFARGARSLFLEVSCNNRAARGLYAGLGFVEAGRRIAYYREQDGTADALTLKATLPLMLGKARGLD